MTKDPELKAACQKSLDQVLIHCGTKAEMARKANTSRNAVSSWFSRGRIGRIGAMRLSRLKSIPFTKEELRPDIKNWTPMSKRKK